MKFGAKIPVNYKNNLSIKCYLDKVHTVTRHYHDSISIIFVINGELNVLVNDKDYQLKSDDILLINSNEVHEAFSYKGAICTILQFNPKDLKINEDLYFNCYTHNGINSKDEFELVKKKLALMIKGYANSDLDYSLLSTFYDLITILKEHFYANKNENSIKNNKYKDRSESIIKYIEENYRKGISLKDIADHEYLSVSYLSAFFEKMFGKNFLDFYNDIRLDSAIQDLIYSDDSINEIAINNGFNDPRSFVSVFKKRYDTLPSVYRSNHKRVVTEITNESSTLTKDEIELSLKTIAKYTELQEKSHSSEDAKATSIEKINDVNIMLAGEKYEKNLTVFTGVGSAYDILLSDVQDLLKRVQKDLHFKYIKFHGILDDDLEIYTEDAFGNPRYNFYLLDKVLYFLLSINLKPLIQLSFMPKDLALDPNKTIFNGEYITSYPKDMKKWKDLIEALMDHLVNQYGQAEVESWLFTIWNEEETGSKLFGLQEGYDFFELFKQTYMSVKDVLPGAKMGSTSFTLSNDDKLTWIDDFLLKTKKENIKIDFLVVHYFSDVFTQTSSNYTYNSATIHRDDKDHFKKTIAYTKEKLVNLGFANLPIYMTTWNFTASHRQLISDTCFKSCYLAKNYLENYNELKSYGYWSLTDLNHESMFDNELFHGGLGFFTRNGIEKSAYNAYLLLNKLDNEVIAKGEGYFITKSSNSKKIHIFLYNYVHFNSLFSNGQLVIDSNNRYLPFDMKNKKRFIFKLINLPPTKAFIKEYIVNEHHGSSYDAYVKMGNCNLKNEDEFEYLKANSIPQLKLSEKEIENNEILFERDLLPLEIRLIELKLR